MCRICGCFGGDVPPGRLAAAAALQRHGGPDQHGLAHGDGWSLCCDRLAIMDPAGGSQPYRGRDVAIVFNGELYNAPELRRELEAKGHRFHDRCDGSILPALYREHDVRFAERLDGMFAIAVVDLRSEPRLVLATDDAGMKSLYLHWDERTGRLCFASELPALLALPGVERSPWLEGLDTYLTTKAPFGERTLYASISALAPGATAVCTRSGGLRIVTRPRPLPDDGDPTPHDLTDASERLGELLREAVEALLGADAPVGSIASGGLDSSVVTALAAAARPGLQTFHVAYRGAWPHDERGFARLVAQQAGTRHTLVELDPARVPELLPTVVRHLGQPNADPIAVSTYALFEGVRAAGCKVALTGDGADELLCGYDRLRAALAAPLGADWVGSYVDALGAMPRAVRETLYTREYRDHLDREGRVADELAGALAGAGGAERAHALVELEAGRRLPSYHLRRVDHLAMAHGVEARMPFCQRRVAHWARSLPPALLAHDDAGKRPLRDAARGLVPEAVRTRPKQPFTLPIAAMMRAGQPLLDHVRAVLDPHDLRRDGLLDPRAVGRMLDEQARRPTADGALGLWALTVFQTWRHQRTGAHARGGALEKAA